MKKLNTQTDLYEDLMKENGRNVNFYFEDYISPSALTKEFRDREDLIYKEGKPGFYWIHGYARIIVKTMAGDFFATNINAEDPNFIEREGTNLILHLFTSGYITSEEEKGLYGDLALIHADELIK